MSIDHFLTKTNVILMWELIDENRLQYKSYDVIKEIKILFDNNLIPFFEKEKYKTKNVMELNKKYISLILHYINNNYSSSQDNNILQNNSLQNYTSQKELITYEDLQSDRLSHFEKQLSLKQQEFSFAMQSKVPETPNFKDNLDEPMREMDITMKRTIAQRNYDIEQLNLSLNQNKSIELKDNWLEPKETSIKNENIKLNQLQNQLPSQTQKYSQPYNKNSDQVNNIKFIKTDDIKNTWDLCDAWITDNKQILDSCPENKTGIKFNSKYNGHFTYNKEITKLTEIQEPWSKFSENTTTLTLTESQKNVEQETK
jgi:hypothetical protein